MLEIYISLINSTIVIVAIINQTLLQSGNGNFSCHSETSVSQNSMQITHYKLCIIGATNKFFIFNKLIQVDYTIITQDNVLTE